MDSLKICRLCLQSCTNNSHSLETLKDLLNTLLLNLNLEITKEPLVCDECTANLKNCLAIKMSCPSTEKLSAFKAEASEEEKQCHFCLKLAQNECLIDLYETKDNMFIVEMLSKHIPEVNLSATKELLTCENCQNLLKIMHNFVFNCLDVEDKIKNYVELEGTNDNGHIELNYVQETKPIFLPEVKYEDLGEEKAISCGVFLRTGTAIKCEDFSEDKNEEVYIKSEHNDSGRNAKNSLESKIYQCNYCLYRTKFKGRLKQHTLIHMDPSQSQQHKCEFCPYATKRKSHLTDHMLIHKNCSELQLYKCELCPFTTKRKRNLKDHLITHQDCSEVNMHKCSVCLFQSKHKKVLTRHMLVHKTPEELTMYKCDMCPYRAKIKYTLNKHQKVHKKTKEATRYMCDSCGYRTKFKGDLKRHIVLHKDSSEVTMHSCNLCMYKTRVRRDLTKHMVIHKDRSEITMHKCTYCTYETRHKSSLTMHHVVHKDPSELKMFKCPFCPYETKLNRYLKKHLSIHQRSFVDNDV